jgi:hypothetical protein
VRIRRPRCYHAAVVEGTADVVVVMEDLAPAVIAGMLVSRTERSDAMFVTMANRHAIQARDLGAAELLS